MFSRTMSTPTSPSASSAKVSPSMPPVAPSTDDEGEGAEARFLLAALALDPDEEADRQRQRELKESRKVLPAGYVTGHSKRMYSTTGGGDRPRRHSARPSAGYMSP